MLRRANAPWCLRQHAGRRVGCAHCCAGLCTAKYLAVLVPLAAKCQAWMPEGSWE